MGHVLEEYAKSLGCNVGRPQVQKHFFPLREKKYITINGDHRIPAKNYPYYFLVISLLRERLKDIKVFQLGGADKPIKGADKILDGLSFKQYAYILSRSSLHLGPDNVFMHYASSQNIPIVTVFGNVYPETTEGYWSKPINKVNIASPWEMKPCLGIQDPENSIFKIAPEDIVNASLKMMGDRKPINFKTLRMGADFHHEVIEIIPTKYVPLPVFKDHILNVRMDMGGDVEAVFNYCQNHVTNLILDSKVIPIEILQKFSSNVRQITIFMDEEVEDIPLEYLEAIKKMGLNIKILTRQKESLENFRVKYFDFNVGLFSPPTERPENVPEGSQFFSNKLVVDGENLYPSRAHWQKSEKDLDKSSILIEDKASWEDIEHFLIYERY